MRTGSEGVVGKNKEGGGKAANIVRLLWPRLMELWIFLVIVIFFLIRVLGSHTAQRLLSSIGLRHFP